jgi:hypothetical protein
MTASRNRRRDAIARAFSEEAQRPIYALPAEVIESIAVYPYAANALAVIALNAIEAIDATAPFEDGADAEAERLRAHALDDARRRDIGEWSPGYIGGGVVSTLDLFPGAAAEEVPGAVTGSAPRGWRDPTQNDYGHDGVSY